MKRFESFGLDAANECLWRRDEQIALPPKPFAVLRFLVDNPGRLITHDELLDALWPETYVQPQVLRTYVLELRKILGDDAKDPRFIQTMPKRGYRFVAAVREGDARAESAANAVGHAAAFHSHLVGRDAELARLRELWQQARAGQRQVVFVTGEAGIGKTALLEAFCRELKPDGALRVAHGHCVEGMGLREEYFAVKEALNQLCVTGDEVERILARSAPDWMSALRRETASGGIAAVRNAERELPPGDLCAALEEIAAELPLVLVIEDIHWSDAPTIDLIAALGRRRATARLMVIATCKQHHCTAEAALKAMKNGLLMRRLGEEVALTPLVKTDVRRLLSRELGQDALPHGLAEFVLRRSEGNPLFVLAVLEQLVAQKFLVRSGENGMAAWKQTAPFHEIEAGVPAGLAEMIELELERLSDRERRILEAGSLISVAFPTWAVAAALEEDEAEIEEACDELAARLRFVQRAGQDELPGGARSSFYVFAHELYREVLYNRQAPARRAKRHLCVADKLGELFQGRESRVAAEMAMHYEAASSWLRAANALRTAARHALERKAYSEAWELLDRALELAANLEEMERERATAEIRAEMMAAKEPVLNGASREKRAAAKA